jgi:hypothetical protein
MPAVIMVRSFTRALMIRQPVSLVCLVFEKTTGGCRVLATITNAAGLSRDSLPYYPIIDSRYGSSYTALL